MGHVLSKELSAQHNQIAPVTHTGLRNSRQEVLYNVRRDANSLRWNLPSNTSWLLVCPRMRASRPSLGIAPHHPPFGGVVLPETCVVYPDSVPPGNARQS